MSCKAVIKCIPVKWKFYASHKFNCLCKEVKKLNPKPKLCDKKLCVWFGGFNIPLLNVRIFRTKLLPSKTGTWRPFLTHTRTAFSLQTKTRHKENTSNKRVQSQQLCNGVISYNIDNKLSSVLEADLTF